MELREEMMKKPILPPFPPVVDTKKPKQKSPHHLIKRKHGPPLHENLYFHNLEREFDLWVRSVDERDMESYWHSRRCFMGTEEGRTSPSGFSNV